MGWSEWRENRDIELVSSLLHILTIVTAVLAPLAVVFVSVFYIPSIKSAILGGVVATITTIICYRIMVGLTKARKSKQTDWNPWIYISSRSISVNVSNQSEISYKTKLNMKILNHDVTRIIWRLGWSGEGEIEVQIKNKGFSFEVEPSSHDISKILTIYFDRPMNRGENVELEFEIRTVATVPAKPFYSLTFFDSKLPKHVSISVAFANAVGAHSIQKATFANDTAAWPMVPPESVELDTHNAISWIVRPVFGQRYCISWEYP